MRSKQNRTKGKGSAPIIRREEAAEHVAHGGAWKVAYADFVTAMMAFFLLMWLMNATTEDQRKGLADYFSPSNMLSHNSSGTGQPFGGRTAFEDGALVSDRGAVQITFGERPALDNQDEPDTEIPGRPDQPKPRPGTGSGEAGTAPAANLVGRAGILPRPLDPLRPVSEPETAGLVHPPGKAGTRAQQDAAAQEAKQRDAAAQEAKQLDAAAQQLKQAVQDDPALAGLAQHLAIDVTPAGLRIQLLDTQKQAMFALGSAVPNDAARLLLSKIAPALIRLPEQISIGGHTDAAPYPGPAMTNWELSTERANAARRMLIASGLPESRLQEVTGHADHDLLLPADPLAAANRRIAILVLRGTATPPALVKPGPAGAGEAASGP
jgi:chemotaxis protein MotB